MRICIGNNHAPDDHKNVKLSCHTNTLLCRASKDACVKEGGGDVSLQMPQIVVELLLLSSTSPCSRSWQKTAVIRKQSCFSDWTTEDAGIFERTGQADRWKSSASWPCDSKTFTNDISLEESNLFPSTNTERPTMWSLRPRKTIDLISWKR